MQGTQTVYNYLTGKRCQVDWRQTQAEQKSTVKRFKRGEISPKLESKTMFWRSKHDFLGLTSLSSSQLSLSITCMKTTTTKKKHWLKWIIQHLYTNKSELLFTAHLRLLIFSKGWKCFCSKQAHWDDGASLLPLLGPCWEDLSVTM